MDRRTHLALLSAIAMLFCVAWRPGTAAQLGAELHMIGLLELASGDLSRYHAVVTASLLSLEGDR